MTMKFVQASKFIRRITSAAIVICFASVSLSGCQSSGVQGTAVNQDKLKLSWTTVLYTAKPPSDTVIKEIEKATNTDLSIVWVPDNLKEDKLNIALASGALTQIVTIQDIKSSAFLSSVRAETFWEIGPYLNEYSNLSRMDETILNNLSIDGKIYGIYRERDLSRQGVIYRKDWLQHLSLQPPDDLESLYGMIKAFTKDDPDGNGIADTYGLTDRNDLKFGAFQTLASYFGSPNEWGLKEGQLQPEFMFDAYRETMKFMRLLYEEKLINAQFAVTSKQQQWDDFIKGKAGVYIGNLDDARNLQAAAIKNNSEVEIDMINRIKGPDGAPHVWSQAGHNGMFVFPKSEVKTVEELKQILSFFNRLGDPEMYNLLNYGIEDVHYQMKSGEMELLPDDSNKWEQEVRPLISLMGMSNPTLKLFGDPLRDKSDQLNKDNKTFIVQNPAEALESSTQNERGSELKTIIHNAVYLYILGKIDDKGFDEAITNWKKSGGEQVMKEINEAYHFQEAQLRDQAIH